MFARTQELEQHTNGRRVSLNFHLVSSLAAVQVGLQGRGQTNQLEEGMLIMAIITITFGSRIHARACSLLWGRGPSRPSSNLIE
jgi:hypothetical protein